MHITYMYNIYIYIYTYIHTYAHTESPHPQKSSLINKSQQGWIAANELRGPLKIPI